MAKQLSKFFRKLITKTIGFVSILIILFVLLLSLVKFSLPYWLEKKESITGFVESYIGGEIDYQSMTIDWSGFHPIINITELSWNKKQLGIELSSHNNQIKLNLWKTLYQGYLATEEVAFDQLKLDYYYPTSEVADQTHQQAAVNLDLAQIKFFFEEHPELFQHQQIKVSQLEFNLHHQTKVMSQQVSLLSYEQLKKQKQLVVKSHGEIIDNATLILESEGDLLAATNPLDWYLDFEGFNLAELERHLATAKPLGLEKLQLKNWLQFSGSQLTKGRLEAKTNDQATNQLDAIINFSYLNKNFNLQSEKFEIELATADSQTQPANQSFKGFVSLASQQISEYESLIELKAEQMPIAYLIGSIMPFVPLDSANYFLQAKPSGIIEQVDLTVEQIIAKGKSQFKPTEGKLSLSDLSLSPVAKQPGIEISSLLVWRADDLWRFKLNGDDGELNWPYLFQEKVAFDDLSIEGNVSFLNDTKVQIEQLKLNNSEAKVLAAGQLNFDQDQQFDMTLYAEAQDIKIGRLYRYWPRNGSFSPKALDYLDNSLVGGKVDFAKFVWRGGREFPFADGGGVFNIQADVVDGKFKFQPDWPIATSLKAYASFENEKLIINADQADLVGISLQQATAIIPNLKADDHKLLLEAKANADYSSFKRLYQASPLQEILGPELIAIEFDKTVDASLNLNLLMADELEKEIDGKVTFKKNRITGIPYELAVANLQGDLKFSDNGAVAENLTANFLGNPTQLEVRVKGDTSNDSLLQINALSQFSVERATKAYGIHNPLTVTGQSPVTIHYELDNNEPANESLIVRTDWLGASIDGPDWLGKESQQAAPLLLTLLKQADQVSIRTVYRDQVSSKLSFNTEQPEKITGIIQLGDIATDTLPLPDSGVAIEGYFQEINLSDWLDSFQFEKSSQNFDWPNWISQLNLTTPKLIVAGQEFTKVRVNDEQIANEEFGFSLFSEQAKGNISFFADGLKKIQLEQFHLDWKPWQEVSNSTSDFVTPDFSKTDFANWQFICKVCSINGYDLGYLDINSQLINNEIMVNGSSQVAGQLAVNLDARWADIGTEVSVDYNIPKPSNLLAHWKLDGEIEDTATNGNLKLSWPGGFHDFSLAKATGSFQLDSTKGAIKDLSDKKARIFSLFSLQSIPRRLSLDFSDLFNDGFYYEKITGRFDIADGKVISKKVEIAGTAADVRVNGSVDLINQQVDQQVLVVPKLGSSLPLLAGWAIEPTTGIAMFLLSKIFEPALDVVASIEYKISGDLDDPHITEVSKTSKKVTVNEDELEEAAEEGAVPEVETEKDEKEAVPADD